MTAKLHNRILMTGAAGGLGKAMREPLKANCNVLRLSDRAPITAAKDSAAKDHEELMQVDLADAAAVFAMCEGVDAVVHFGGFSVEGEFEGILQANIIGAYNLYEAARKQGIRRIVFASTNHVTGFYKQSETITAAHPPRPDSMYGVSKAFGEDLSRFYFDRYGIETACIRIGSSFPEPRDRRMLASWLSYGDLHRLITACLTTPVLGHSIVFGVSDNPVKWYDNCQAKHVGYVPKDSSQPFHEGMYAKTPAPDLSDPTVQYQGGGYVRMGPFE